MKKDLFVKILRKVAFIWREAKKPVLHIDTEGDITLLPYKKCKDDDRKPKLRFNLDVEFTLVYILLVLIAIRSFICLLFD